MDRRLITAFVVVFLYGLWLRVDTYNRQHPDNDELYELQQITGDLRFTRVFDNKQTYGDHTSFPGEMIMFQFVRGLVDWSAVEIRSLPDMKWEIEGMTRADFWRLASVRIILFLTASLLMAVICFKVGWPGLVGFMVFMFNPHLIYHAFEMRPYSVLPVLAVLNFMAASSKWKEGWHLTLIIFTCLYHAYGPLIAFLPFIYFDNPRSLWFWLGSLFGLSLWVYYASFSSFGMSPNAAQAVVSPYQYFTPSPMNFVTSFLGSGLLFYALVPVGLTAFLKGWNWKFFILLIVLPLLLICLVDIKTSYWIHPRQWVWVMPWFCIFVNGKFIRLE